MSLYVFRSGSPSRDTYSGRNCLQRPAGTLIGEIDLKERPGGRFFLWELSGHGFKLPIPTKPPVYNGMIAPRDSWMMPPPCNEMIPPGAPRLLAWKFFLRYGGSGQAVLDCLPRARRRLSPVSSMRWALWTRRSRMASA